MVISSLYIVEFHWHSSVSSCQIGCSSQGTNWKVGDTIPISLNPRRIRVQNIGIVKEHIKVWNEKLCEYDLQCKSILSTR